MRKLLVIAIACCLVSVLPSDLLAKAGEDQENQIEMSVKGVALHPETNAPVVILEAVEDKRELPIWIGFAEAQAIALRMENVVTPRPMTHDLLKNILEKMDVKVVKVLINDLKNDIFFATIVLESNRHTVRVDSRPSDALALAVRVRAPIYVARFILEKARGMEGKFHEARERARERYGLSAQELTQELVEYFGLSNAEGVLVSEIVEQGIAHKAGLKRGDVIIEVDGAKTANLKEFYDIFAKLEGKKEFSVNVVRDKARVSLTLHIP